LNLVKFLKEEILGFAGILFPPICPLCRSQPLHSNYPGLCDECLAELKPLSSPCCTTCSLPFEGPPGSDHLCEICLRDPPPFSGVIAFGVYAGLLREAVHHFKYEEAFYLHRPLGRLLAGVVTEKRDDYFPDLLIPVPLHISKLRERTYNQSLLLARTLGKTLKLPVEAQGLERTEATAPQQGLKSLERKRNLKGAFTLRKEVKDLRLLLVDDVLTTSATARECSRILVQGGAKEVQVAVLARAPKHF
jgi:ComF family protein